VLLVLVSSSAGLSGIAHGLEEGVVTGEIVRTDDAFLRDYEKLDYGDNKIWQAWGKGLVSLGLIVVRPDSRKPEEDLLLVIDTRTAVAGAGSDEGRFPDLRPGDRIRARYRMGWDALHALEVKKLDE
jgi:hypothetical protein